MDQRVDPPATEACAKRTLLSTMGVGLLLVAAVAASALTIDLPIPTGRADTHGPAYVPASGEWIELGASPHAPAERAAPPVAEQEQMRIGLTAERTARDRDVTRRAPRPAGSVRSINS